jgi:hypothetical protein
VFYEPSHSLSIIPVDEEHRQLALRATFSRKREKGKMGGSRGADKRC